MTRTMFNWDYCIHVSNFDDLQNQDLRLFDPGLGHQLKRRHLGDQKIYAFAYEDFMILILQEQHTSMGIQGPIP